MLTGKQKRFLRSEAHHLQPILQIGKNGIEPVLEQIDEALEARELIKVNMLQNCGEPKEAIEETLKVRGIHIVQQIGNVFILYKPSSKNPTIQLP
ncbi:ribosome assembly RNA-binding protein YhbY [Planococcaceae bacterium Storch 2/2-2]|nr:ribosome assembly RNA-binding protein YhbY [Planococcaceae bacterium Storch 2/2-2]